jgi:hypothetical protein
MSFDNQVTKVDMIKKELLLLKMEYNNKKQELEKEIKVLQDICEHEFIRESDGDYHKPGYYYTCKHCDYFTRYTQVNYTG